MYVFRLSILILKFDPITFTTSSAPTTEDVGFNFV